MQRLSQEHEARRQSTTSRLDDQLGRLRSENQSLLEHNEELLQKFEEAKREWQDEKDFLERALEERFAQMEHFERQCEELRA